MAQTEMLAEVGQSPLRPMRWPFWAPTPPESIEHALDIAGLRAGEHLLDLGSGDGRVLAAAARRGAIATGYEADPRSVAKSRARLAGLRGVRVVEADFNVAPLEADVIFAFLSPTSLFWLRDRFAELASGTRIVTYGYGIVGWRHEVLDQQCFLYRLPAAPMDGPLRPGWREAGIVMAQPPGQTALSAALFGADRGPLDLRVDESLKGCLEVYAAAARVPEPRHVPIDIKFEAGAPDEVATGFVTMQGKPLFICAVSAGQRRLSQRLDAANLARLEALCREVTAGRRPVSDLIESAVPTPVVPASR